MEKTQRLEIAERIRQLRERSRWNQPQIAEKLGLTLRGYQKVEERGTTKFDRVEEIAKIHGADPNWIWEGKEQGETPDLFSQPDGQLDRIEEQLREVAATVDATRAFLLDLAQQRADEAEEAAEDEDQPEARPKPRRAGGSA